MSEPRRRRTTALRSVFRVAFVGLVAACQSTPGPPSGASGPTPGLSEPPTAVTARGRLEPKDGIIQIAGPSRPSVVIAELLVEEGDRVEAGQPIAVLDTRSENEARLARMRAQLVHAKREFERVDQLVRQNISSVQVRDDARLAVDTATAELAAAQAAVDLDTVRAPAAGQIIAVHARRGERVGPDGIAELAQTGHMYAVAEVYETDIARVRVGQPATIESPALTAPLAGAVERIGMKIGKLDVLDADPVARTDARVVEVHILIADGARAAGLSNLQVDVTIQPAQGDAAANASR